MRKNARGGLSCHEEAAMSVYFRCSGTQYPPLDFAKPVGQGSIDFTV
jgi:hypothetical protein